MLVAAVILVLVIATAGAAYHVAHRYLAARPRADAGWSGSLLSAPDTADPWQIQEQMQQMQREIDRVFDRTFKELSDQFPAPVTERLPADPAGLWHAHFSHMRRMQQEIDTMFSHVMDDGGHFSACPGFEEGWASLAMIPAIDLREETNTYVVSVHLPGVETSDVRVALSGPVLSIQARVCDAPAGPRDGGQLRSARWIQRRIRLPVTPAPETVTAECCRGVLRIAIPRESPIEPLEIEVPVR